MEITLLPNWLIIFGWFGKMSITLSLVSWVVFTQCRNPPQIYYNLEGKIQLFWHICFKIYIYMSKPVKPLRFAGMPTARQVLSVSISVGPHQCSCIWMGMNPCSHVLYARKDWNERSDGRSKSAITVTCFSTGTRVREVQVYAFFWPYGARVTSCMASKLDINQIHWVAVKFSFN